MTHQFPWPRRFSSVIVWGTITGGLFIRAFGTAGQAGRGAPTRDQSWRKRQYPPEKRGKYVTIRPRDLRMPCKETSP